MNNIFSSEDKNGFVESSEDKRDEKIISDIFGSYTGAPLDEKHPTQDVDDL